MAIQHSTDKSMTKITSCIQRQSHIHLPTYNAYSMSYWAKLTLPWLQSRFQKEVLQTYVVESLIVCCSMCLLRGLKKTMWADFKNMCPCGKIHHSLQINNTIAIYTRELYNYKRIPLDSYELMRSVPQYVRLKHRLPNRQDYLTDIA